MEFKTPSWVENRKQPKAETLDEIHGVMLLAVQKLLKDDPDRNHDEEVIDSLEQGDIHPIIDEHGENGPLEFTVDIMKMVRIRVSRLWGITHTTKNVPFRERIEVPQSMTLLKELGSQQRAALANVLVKDVCRTLKSLLGKESERQAESEVDDAPAPKPGQMVQKAQRMAEKIAAKDLARVYKAIAGI